MEKVLVTGAAGFIGTHLTNFLHSKGYWVRAVDIQAPIYELKCDDWRQVDLRNFGECLKACNVIDKVYHLAADMGGVGYILPQKGQMFRNNLLIDSNMLDAAKRERVRRFFFSSSACVYNVSKQNHPCSPGLKEEDAFPALPDGNYGWEKLTMEQLMKAYEHDFGLEPRIARYHNIYGPQGTWKGGKEKSVAALCRKVAEASNPGTIEIWGDGKQERSYCYIKDCIEGSYHLMESGFNEPLNIGAEMGVSVDNLAKIIIEISGKEITKTYNSQEPQGVRGRRSDNTLCRKVLDWEPEVGLYEGLEITYKWIEEEIKLDSKICRNHETLKGRGRT